MSDTLLQNATTRLRYLVLETTPIWPATCACAQLGAAEQEAIVIMPPHAIVSLYLAMLIIWRGTRFSVQSL